MPKVFSAGVLWTSGTIIYPGTFNYQLVESGIVKISYLKLKINYLFHKVEY